MALEEYNKKRNFKDTSEPQGSEKNSSKTLRFVIQRHAASRLHYDFRLEIDGVLKSWAVPKGPSLNPADKRLAMMVEDHPYQYRTFQGTIPKGNYGAGEVEIWDEGIYQPLEKTATKSHNLIMRDQLHKNSLKFVLNGKKLKGEFALVKIKNSAQDNAWLLIKHNDRYAVTTAYDAEEHTPENSKVTAFLQTKSKKKSSDSQKIVRFKSQENYWETSEKRYQKIKPMLCKIAEKPFNDAEWAFEIKWDGYRAIADLRQTGTVKLYSRNGLDFSVKFKKIADALLLQEHEMVLDGEIVAYNEKGRVDFQRLQNDAENPNATICYQVFDLLWLNGHWVTNLTYLQRKELLQQALIENNLIKFHDHLLEKGIDFFHAAEQIGIEGIVAKKNDSVYRENIRSSEWLKIKINKTDEVLICGFTKPKGSRKNFGSLILGKYLNDEIVFCGHTGTGFKDTDLDMLYQRMLPLISNHSAFSVNPKTNDKPFWVKPELVTEIKYTELTADKRYRHPVYLRLREDINPIEVSFDFTDKNIQTMMKKTPAPKKSVANDLLKKIGTQQVKLTNQNKIYFPEDNLTKGDVVEYYQQMSKFILPHIKNRPQSINRYPNGINGLSFFQKDVADETPDFVATEKVFSESTDKFINYLICNNKASLAYLNNLGCIELNVWTSRIQKVDNPDYLVLDLDPSAKNTFNQVIETAWAVKEVLDKAGIQGYPKTSGSSGIHIYIPMGTKYSYTQVKNFGELLMQLVLQKLPELTTLERSLKKRDTDKIYLDYLQNRHAQTLASVYSLRPKNGAPVSMPLEWNELQNGLLPTHFNIHNALQRVKDKGDLFKPVLGKGINMLKAIEKLS